MINNKSAGLQLCLNLSAPDHQVWVYGFWEPRYLSRYRNGVGTGRSGFDFQQGQEIFLTHHNVQTCSRAHPAPYPMSIGGSFPRGKAVGA
jgi:hypothetical protein